MTSVGLSAPTSDFKVSGSPVTSSGTLALNWKVAPTNADTANAIVKRDGTGSFSAGTISAVTLTASNPAGLAIEASTAAANGAIIGTNTGTSAVADGVDGVTNSAFASGVAGINNGGGIGVYATGGTGAYGISGSGIGVYGTSGTSGGTGVYGQVVSASASGARGSGAGVWGDTSSLGPAVFASADDGFALVVYNNSPGANTVEIVNFASGNSVPVFVAAGNGGFSGCFIDGGGDLSCTGTKSAVVQVDSGKRKVALSAIESPKNWFEDFGSAQLSGGSAVVALDPDFIQTVNTERDYMVIPVPNGECKGLYVTNQTPTSFEVRELGSGASSIRFQYRIVALRRRYEDVRFADHTNDPDPRKMMGRMKGMHAKGQPAIKPMARTAAPPK